MEEFYTDLTFRISRLVTRSYSTSFSIAVSYLNREMKDAIYSIYGFVRFADEIVDSFHDYEKNHLLQKFESDYYEAARTGISMNPILHSFARVVKKYRISDHLVQAFLRSMKSDLHQKNYNNEDEIGDYIYGSAEVVGLMCLKVFLDGDETAYAELEDPARRLGSAFQKVNFLRDLKNDTAGLGRQYFPEMAGKPFNEEIKKLIIADIENDFRMSFEGLQKLPGKARLGVLIAYKYYLALLRKIKKTPASLLMEKRIRVSDARKMILLFSASVRNRLNIL